MTYARLHQELLRLVSFAEALRHRDDGLREEQREGVYNAVTWAAQRAAAAAMELHRTAPRLNPGERYFCGCTGSPCVCTRHCQCCMGRGLKRTPALPVDPDADARIERFIAERKP